MQEQNNMSAQPVDVLAVMDRAASQHWMHQDNADAEDMEAARAAVAELVEAGRELRDAQSDYDRLDAPGGKKWDRLCFARERHTAALARVQGGAA